jgi:GDP-L-fucose synthase
MERYDDSAPINIGVGEDLSILELARMIARVIGYDGNMVFDSSKPDGTPRKLLDVTRLHGLGWKARIGLEDGIRDTYSDYVSRVS